MELFARGKRSLIYKDGEIIIKEERKDIQAINRIENEAQWLQILNKKGLGPKYLKLQENKIYMEYIEGPNLEEYLQTHNQKEQLKIFKQLLEQAYTLDTMKVNKLEMHRVTKNGIVRKGKLILLDFERCKRTPAPKNVTQTCQFITKYFPSKSLLEKAKKYKQTYAEKDYKDIQKCLTNIS
ncbi:hypothetical protein EXS74_02425 [Candidatus Woesearchaeota archaeon]|nr:hypothetical protein [Candidatus Woesearchaeota archaeon]